MTFSQAPSSQIRDEIASLKRIAAKALKNPPPEFAVDADSPLPFSIKKLWFDLDDYERKTFNKPQGGDPCGISKAGDPEKLISNEYPKPGPGGSPPNANPTPRRIGKQLELLKSRLLDARFDFLFSPGNLTPTVDGKITGDLDELIASWIGHDRQISVLDVSGLPSEVISIIVGTMLHMIYDIMFWAAELDIGGRQQPLFILLEEAHLFLPEGIDSPAHRTISKVAKEGRKYGVGLGIVTQRPSEIDSTALSQCGTIIALRTSNDRDRGKIESAMPDDLGSISAMLPSLRTGEGIVIGEAMPIPSRIQFFRASSKKTGSDPEAAVLWRKAKASLSAYTDALVRWRRKSIKEPKK